VGVSTSLAISNGYHIPRNSNYELVDLARQFAFIGVVWLVGVSEEGIFYTEILVGR
jgi:hypothetical protein